MTKGPRSSDRTRIGRALEIAAQLELRLAAPSIRSAAPWVLSFEATLLDLVHQMALAQLRDFAASKDESFLLGSDTLFHFAGQTYDFYWHGDIRSGKYLTARIENINSERPRPERKAGKASIREPGRFSGVRLYTDMRFVALRDSLAEMMAADIEAGYRWCTQELKAVLTKGLRGIGEEIGLHLRKRLPDNLADAVSPYVLDRGVGLYLTDEEGRLRGLRRAGHRPLHVRESPTELMARFATQVLESDELFSKEAIRARRLITRDLSSTPYQETRFDIAEQAVLRYQDLAVKPLVWEGETLLVAGFHADLIDPLDDILEREKPALVQLLETKVGNVRRVIQELTKEDSRFWIDPELAAWGVKFLHQLAS